VHTFFICLGVGLCLLIFLDLYRAVFGPTVIDRIMGVNVVGTKATVLLIIIGVIYHRVDMFVDIAIAYALLNFIGTLGASRLFQRRKTLRPTGEGWKAEQGGSS